MSVAHAETIRTLIEEIAVKHGISVGKDDPILVLHTINQRLLDESHESQKKLLADFRAEMSEICVETVQESKVAATAIMNGGVQAAKKALSNVMEDQRENIRAEMRQEISSAVRDLGKTLEDVKAQLRLILISASVIGVAIVGGAFLVGT